MRTSFASSTVVALAMALGSAGCMISGGASVEAGRGRYDDPMGRDYDGADGTIGWRSESERGVDMVASFAYGTQRLGCNTRRDSGKMAANCPGEGTVVFAFQDHRSVYRLCQKGTPRMTCRAQWERIHEAMRGGPTGEPNGAPTITPSAGPTTTPTTTPTTPTTGTPPGEKPAGDWF